MAPLDFCSTEPLTGGEFRTTKQDVIEFDENKRQANLAKHGCDFLIAEAFDWSTAIVKQDTRFDYGGETRFNALGLIGVSLYSLVYAERGSNVRVISLRPASRKERTLYAKATP